MKVLIGTKNPGKITGAKQAFLHYFKDIEVEGIEVSSDVSDEPVNDEVYQGARNRVNNLIKYAVENNIEADYFLGVESGIFDKLGNWSIIQIACIKDKNGVESWGNSSGFPVPERYVDRIINENLGVVMDEIYNADQIGKGKGGVGMLTKGVLTRYDMTEQALIMALTMFINGDTWR